MRKEMRNLITAGVVVGVFLAFLLATGLVMAGGKSGDHGHGSDHRHTTSTSTTLAAPSVDTAPVTTLADPSSDPAPVDPGPNPYLELSYSDFDPALYPEGTVFVTPKELISETGEPYWDAWGNYHGVLGVPNGADANGDGAITMQELQAQQESMMQTYYPSSSEEPAL